MENAAIRLQELVEDTLQILNHMKVGSENNGLLQQIKMELNEQKSAIDKLTSKATTVSINKSLDELNSMVLQLETNLLEDYKQSTGDQIDQYELLSLEDQMEQTDNYHNKIDSLSATKIRENINQMNEVLLYIRPQ